MNLGTILPTKKSILESERYAVRQAAMRAKVAGNHPELRNCQRRLVGDEVRYYDTIDQYAIVSRQGKILWFAVRPDGDYRIS